MRCFDGILEFLRNSARFLWKSIPAKIKESRPEVMAVWKIGQRLWTRDYPGVYVAVREFEWSSEVVDIVNAFEGEEISNKRHCLCGSFASFVVASLFELQCKLPLEML